MAASSSSSNPELLQAHVELWNLTYSYLKSMALQCAVELGIPTAVHRAGGAASLPELLAAVPVPEHRKPHLPRLLRFLVVTGILSLDPPSATGTAALLEDNSRVHYRLTPLSRLLVDDDAAVNGCTSLAPFVLSQTTKFHVGAALRLSDWFKGGAAEAEMPFRMAHGTDPWDAMRRDPVVSKMFHDGLGADSRLALDFVVNQCGAVFDGVGTLVDVGGGDGSSARAIARAFPHVKCSVLDLPHVIGGNVVKQPSDGVEYIVGDMMSFIPPTDAVLLKYILHDWNDEDCVKILKQCKKAVCSENKPSGGKVIIIDTVVGSPDKDAFQAQVTADVLMMVMTSGKERDEHEWRKIFMDAGFTHYKTSPVLGFLSIIELYP
ncbi:hypothetical protein PR202_gb03003 [Eleusine coracana subsp. coracana]|uniref:O-methyltransferase ZRP4 n=1 Tax=Eleusine coracana subsp. coracana TaxID=191504 RepID=A0AAV5DZY5_ELECO|nr:hypothetical protein QOZ80_8BG0662080 [Eleusine coracana subsp. coracana]GJN16053.1 hypothetical protein PR202_gb03003 [Eleusine coracana subsp. coracana]